MVGSAYWMPPEMIARQPHSTPVSYYYFLVNPYKADVWSFGVCLLELLLMNPPHCQSTFRCMFLAATVGLVDQIPPEAGKKANDFISQCLVVDPAKRSTVDTLLQVFHFLF